MIVISTFSEGRDVLDERSSVKRASTTSSEVRGGGDSSATARRHGETSRVGRVRRSVTVGAEHRRRASTSSSVPQERARAPPPSPRRRPAAPAPDGRAVVESRGSRLAVGVDDHVADVGSAATGSSARGRGRGRSLIARSGLAQARRAPPGARRGPAPSAGPMPSLARRRALPSVDEADGTPLVAPWITTLSRQLADGPSRRRSTGRLEQAASTAPAIQVERRSSPRPAPRARGPPSRRARRRPRTRMSCAARNSGRVRERRSPRAPSEHDDPTTTSATATGQRRSRSHRPRRSRRTSGTSVDSRPLG